MSSNARIERALEQASEIAERVLKPNAQSVDQGESLPITNLRELAHAGLLGFTTPSRFGGIGASGSYLRRFTETLAAACGVTTFLQGQHQSAALLIAGGENDDLKADLLPRIATGDLMCGVAFSHLRRKTEPPLKVTEQATAFQFDGEAPWVTGWGVMQEVVLAGTLSDGRFLYVVAPLTPNPAMEASAPMPLCAMSASGTVSLTFRGFRVDRRRYVKTVTRDQMARSDVDSILAVTAQPLGACRAAIAQIRENLRFSQDRDVHAAAQALERELNVIRAEVELWSMQPSDNRFKECSLAIRARAIELGIRAAHAALAASGGRGNSLDHPAQRIFREAMFYTLTAQTADVRRATLQRISTRGNGI